MTVKTSPPSLIQNGPCLMTYYKYLAIIPHLFIFFYVHFVRIPNIEYSYPITQSKWKIHLTENGELLQGIEHPIYSVVQNVYVLPAWLASLCLTFWFGHRQDNKCYIILKGLKNFTLFFFNSSSYQYLHFFMARPSLVL